MEFVLSNPEPTKRIVAYRTSQGNLLILTGLKGGNLLGKTGSVSTARPTSEWNPTSLTPIYEGDEVTIKF